MQDRLCEAQTVLNILARRQVFARPLCLAAPNERLGGAVLTT